MVSEKEKEKEKGTDPFRKGKRKITGGGDDDKTGRKRKNRFVIQFIDEEDEDSSDDSMFDIKDIKDKFSADFRVNKEEDRGEEELDRMSEARYKLEAGFVTCMKGGHDRKKSIDRNIYMPYAQDPIIWKVQCVIGRERFSAFRLMKEFARMVSLGNKVQIISACAFEHVKGFIFIEAENRQNIYEACKGLSSIFSSRVAAVLDEELSCLLSVKSKSSGTLEGMWARVKNGMYKGDIAQTDYRIVPISDFPHPLPSRRFEGEPKEGKASICTMRNDLPVFLRALEEYNFMDIVRKYPQIGNFLLLDVGGNFPGAVYHKIMSHMCMTGDDSTLFSLVNNKPVRFSQVEFNLVSGLRFSDKSVVDVQGVSGVEGLKSRWFSYYGENRVPVAELTTCIRWLSERPKGVVMPTDLVNLIYVWVISNVLLPDSSGCVMDYVFELCTDLDICEKYPWGLKVWEATIGGALSSMEKIRGSSLHNWNAPGCPWIVLYWMLEAIDGMQECLGAKRRLEWTMMCPRMLQWCIEGGPPSNTLFDKYLNSAHIVIPRLKPNTIELQSSYFRDTLSWYESNVTCAPDSLRILNIEWVDDYVIFRDDDAPVNEKTDSSSQSIPPPPIIPDSAPSKHDSQSIPPIIPRSTDSVQTRGATEPPVWWVNAQEGIYNRLDIGFRNLNVRIDHCDTRIDQVRQSVEQLRDFVGGQLREYDGRIARIESSSKHSNEAVSRLEGSRRC